MPEAYVDLYHCPDLKAKITRRTCDTNKQRLAWARRKAAAKGAGGFDAQCVARQLACCQGCPGVEARAWAAGMRPNVLAVELPQPVPKLEPKVLPQVECARDGCETRFPANGRRLYCSRQCNDAAKWERRKAAGWSTNRRSA